MKGSYTRYSTHRDSELEHSYLLADDLAVNGTGLRGEHVLPQSVRLMTMDSVIKALTYLSMRASMRPLEGLRERAAATDG